MTRLELATTRPPDVYANQLRYIPIKLCSIVEIFKCKVTKKNDVYKRVLLFFREKV